MRSIIRGDSNQAMASAALIQVTDKARMVSERLVPKTYRTTRSSPPARAATVVMVVASLLLSMIEFSLGSDSLRAWKVRLLRHVHNLFQRAFAGRVRNQPGVVEKSSPSGSAGEHLCLIQKNGPDGLHRRAQGVRASKGRRGGMSAAGKPTLRFPDRLMESKTAPDLLGNLLETRLDRDTNSIGCGANAE